MSMGVVAADVLPHEIWECLKVLALSGVVYQTVQLIRELKKPERL